MGTWIVKAKSPASGEVSSTLKDGWAQAVELRDEFIAKGYESWIEDTNGKKVG